MKNGVALLFVLILTAAFSFAAGAYLGHGIPKSQTVHACGACCDAYLDHLAAEHPETVKR